MRVAGAADGTEQRLVVDVAPGGRVQAGPFGQPGGEQAGAQAVFERHAGRQVRGQANRGDQLGQLDAVARERLHPVTLPQVSCPLRDSAAARPVRDENGRMRRTPVTLALGSEPYPWDATAAGLLPAGLAGRDDGYVGGEDFAAFVV